MNVLAPRRGWVRSAECPANHNESNLCTPRVYGLSGSEPPVPAVPGGRAHRRGFTRSTSGHPPSMSLCGSKANVCRRPRV
jgi:hypothetical protein